MIKLTTELQPGKIFYHVCGVNRTETKSGSISRYIVASGTYDVELGLRGVYSRKSPFFRVICEYENYTGQTESYSTERSAHDMGVFKPGEKRSVHNLNRGFWTREEAEQFIKELQEDKFSDPDDQAYADRLTPIEDFRRQKEFMDSYLDSCDYDYYDFDDGEE